ncbi:MAG: trypsin-like peptidase domain-containing protein, partial [Planctomycetota bacterium]|nr:trypsin-like peptidase domain-containing protein [Planctomycetota bacterium]
MLTLPVLLVASVIGGSAAPDLDNGVLDFTAKWCGPCQEMSPIVSRLERAGLPIYKVDFDQNQKLAKKYGVTRIPTFILVVNGKVVKQLTGPQSESTLRQMCQQVPAADTRDGSARDAEMAAVPRKTVPRPNEVAKAGAVTAPRGQSPDKPKLVGPLVTNQPFPATVRIRVKDASGDDVGTGTVIYNGDEQALILTCGHLFKHWDDKTSRLMVEVFEKGSGRVVAAKKIAADLDGDVALISIPTDKPLPFCPLAARGTKPPKSTPLVSVGCNGGQPPTLEQHKVLALNRYKGPDNLECTGIPVRGRSGGGLFNQAGEVVGVCMAEDPNYKDGMYAGLEPVYRLLARAQLGHLFEGASVGVESGAIADLGSSTDGAEEESLDGAPAGRRDEDDSPQAIDENEDEDDPAAAPAPKRLGPKGGSRGKGVVTANVERGEGESAPGNATTHTMLRKALAQARKGDIVCLIPEEDGEAEVGTVLVIHEPGEDLRRTLAGGPDGGAIRSAS